MCFFRRKKALEDTIYDRNFVVRSVDVLIELAESQEIKDELLKIKEEIKFSKPSNDHDVVRYDKGIEKELGDLKIMLSAGKNDEKVKDKMAEVKLLIVERNSRVD